MKHINQSSQTSGKFTQVPEFLMTDSRYNHIRNDTKLLYSLLLDRHSLSKSNGWIDNKGVYIIFTRAEMANVLNCSIRRVSSLIGQLKLVGLIHEKRQGLNKPNLIYVQGQRPMDEVIEITEAKTPPDIVKTDPQTPTDKGSANCAYQDMTIFADLDAQDLPTSYTNNNQTNNINPSIDLSTQQSIKSDKIELKDKNKVVKDINYSTYVNRIKDQIFYDALNEEENLFTQRKIDSLINLMAHVYSLDDTDTVRINNTNMSAKYVKIQFEKINHACIEYILESLNDNTLQIKNMRAYMLTCLYNAPDTVDFHAETAVAW